MNILFITDSDVYHLRGGIDRIVSIVGSALAEQADCKCHLAYFDTTDNTQTAPFEERIQLSKTDVAQQLSHYITAHSINRIVVSTAMKSHTRLGLPLIKQIIAGKNISLYFWFHGMPGYELVPLNPKVAWYRILHQPDKTANVKRLVMAVLSSFPAVQHLMHRMLCKKYAFYSLYADKVVVLAQPYITSFAALSGASKDQVVAINNVLTFTRSADEKTLSEKEKIVLIVARMDEESKRIVLALKIWKLVEQRPEYAEWKLVIVGNGDDENYCKRLAEKLKLRHCLFEGRQNPLEYYRRASIFMMTSSNEGFPMTLGEAQQMGVVPIAFDSFGALHDIIQDNHNGIIVPNNQLALYAEKMMDLMKNDEKRKCMAENAVVRSTQFSAENIIKQWVKLFSF